MRSWGYNLNVQILFKIAPFSSICSFSKNLAMRKKYTFYPHKLIITKSIKKIIICEEKTNISEFNFAPEIL